MSLPSGSCRSRARRNGRPVLAEPVRGRWLAHPRSRISPAASSRDATDEGIFPRLRAARRFFRPARPVSGEHRRSGLRHCLTGNPARPNQRPRGYHPRVVHPQLEKPCAAASTRSRGAPSATHDPPGAFAQVAPLSHISFVSTCWPVDHPPVRRRPHSKGDDSSPTCDQLSRGDAWTWMLYSNSQTYPVHRSLYHLAPGDGQVKAEGADTTFIDHPRTGL